MRTIKQPDIAEMRPIVQKIIYKIIKFELTMSYFEYET